MIGVYIGTTGSYSVISLKDSPITPDTPTGVLYVLKTALPSGINPGDFVYFENTSGNIATNVRAAIKTTSRNAQFFEVDTWS
jgi:hypothetical protein